MMLTAEDLIALREAAREDEDDLDSSNATPPEPTDFNLRVMALQFAIASENSAAAAGSGANGYLDQTLTKMRGMYLFLTGRDPVTDLGATAEGDNVIVVDFAKGQRLKDDDTL